MIHRVFGSGRAKCIVCHSQIGRGEKCLSYNDSFGNHVSIRYQHEQCIIDKTKVE